MVAEVSSGVATHQIPKKPPLLPSQAENGPRRPKHREVTSRYLSSSNSSASTNSTSNSSSFRPLPSPMHSRTVPMTPASVSRSSQFTERRRPATPRPFCPSNSGEMIAAGKGLVSTARSLSASFQFGDSINKAKPAPLPPQSSSNTRRSTPEAPLRDHTIDQHQWPGKLGQENSLTRSVGSSTVVRALLQKSMTDSGTGPCDPISSDTESVSSESSTGLQEGVATNKQRGIIVPARVWKETNNRVRRVAESPPGSPEWKKKNDSRGLSSSSPLRGVARHVSPTRNVTSSSTMSSPSRSTKSPSRTRNGITNAPNCIPNVDARSGKVGNNKANDVHSLRMQYNRLLQWRFVNAKSDAAMSIQKATAEKSLYNAWMTASELRHSIGSKRIELEMLRRNLKLYSILKGQMEYLANWDGTDKDDHSRSLSGLVEALEARTIRLPIDGCAKADINDLEDSISVAVDVMQSIENAIRSFSTKVEHVNSLASELASITTNEHASLDQCKDLLSTMTALQVNDCSLRTYILQHKHEPSFNPGNAHIYSANNTSTSTSSTL